MENWVVTAAVVAGAVCLVLLDRALLGAERRGWLYYRRTKGRAAAFVEEFSPAAQAVRRAMEQERVRKNVRPAEGPPLGVDLDARVARIPSGGSGRNRSSAGRHARGPGEGNGERRGDGGRPAGEAGRAPAGGVRGVRAPDRRGGGGS
ncbi:hypothetical protein [Streptomyces uncialis]|uniref:hypothetical protein n=1 Tax=Streptomyces uncialis TaxID=1048205 RepID=UPI0022571535|nr:hypothetical protein [Streptomyces uncialis]MCX4662753.1 hypothetical protein [Streptomyces uncialis]